MTRRLKKPDRLKSEPPLRHPSREKLSFSFSNVDLHGSFSLNDAPDGYLIALVQRLRDIGEYDARELKTSKSSALRCHEVRFSDTTEPGGFAHLNDQFKLYTPYQISISSNEHGRIHGFFIDSVFHVVWLDHSHRLYN